MQKKNHKVMKIIIISTIAIMLLLLLIFSKNIIKLQNSNKQNIAESIDNTQTLAEANKPRLSAGMIPVKWDGENWIITSKDDTDWYDYSQGKPAYIMLNDGTYQSEIQANMTNKKLASENVGVGVLDDPTNTMGSIYMWIPRFAINSKTNEIKYIKDIEKAEEGFIIPDLFMYKQADETKPDFLLTGVWVEKNIDTNYASKITQMNKEESIYGFIANTKATQITTDDTSALQTFVGVGVHDDPILNDIINTNRIILKIINDKNQDPIKANASYNKDTGLITVQVTYSQYRIEKILLQNTTELTFTKTNGMTTADTTGIDLEDGDKVITIVDNKGNKKELTVKVIPPIYVTLYTDGTLGFCSNNSKIAGKTVSVNYGDISGKEYNSNDIPWYSQREKITTVDFVNKVSPISTAYWFREFKNLTTINNIKNLNTKNVTNMKMMFYYCSSLTSLDLSNFDTSNVTNMQMMFRDCSRLTTLNVSKFDTSNVTDMVLMFYSCSGLTSLDLSNFDTSNVTYMYGMFRYCSGLISIDVSNFDTGNVTDINNMFDGCSGLTSLDIKNFDTRNVIDMASMFNGCTSLTSLDLSNFDTNNVINMGGMFNGCTSLTSLNLKNFDTSNVTSMPNMFSRCSALTSLEISNFDTSNVINMGGMFSRCSALTSLDLSNFDTNNVINMGGMFNGCTSLTSLNLKNFDTSNVTSMPNMFSRCSALTSLDLSNFDTSNVTNMSSMFNSCSSLTQLNISNFNTTNVTDMNMMFLDCTSLTQLDLSSFDVSKVTDFERMFYGCTNLKTIYVNKSTTMWPTSIRNSTSSSSKYYNMFKGCGTSTVTRK